MATTPSRGFEEADRRALGLADELAVAGHHGAAHHGGDRPAVPFMPSMGSSRSGWRSSGC